MTKQEMQELTKMMMQMFNDGVEAIVLPEFGRIDDRFERMDKRFENLEENMKKMKTELIEAFKTGQQSISNRLEEMEVDMRQILKDHKDYGKRLDKVEGVVRAN